jgi:predicted Zn-dependent protease
VPNYQWIYYQTQKKRHLSILAVPFFLLVLMDAKAGYRVLPCPEEKQAAHTALQKINNEWPTRGSGDPVSQYIQKLGYYLGQLIPDGRRIGWHFEVVRNLAPNAFSIGNGYIFVTEGAINLAQNESELAAILAHEIGHELAGHFCNESSTKFSFDWSNIFSPPTNRSRQVGIGSMIQTIDPLKEQQADRIALHILQVAGFNPQAMLDISRRLPVESGAHFTDALRMQSLERAIAFVPSKPMPNSAEFLSIKQRLSSE